VCTTYDGEMKLYITGLCSATYVRWQRGTARIRPPLLQQFIDIPAGPTAANLQRSGFAGTDRQTDGHRTAWYEAETNDFHL